ncbi:hypothetical protein POTOM_028633 [Populus tomentosa]|uniref:Ribosomal protein L17 family protein n=1 Tax=Populus tomentosa TaxID=118781 RepID=A0A8X7ZAR1_POPTO|nr:hypothetical protein POTOM_028633 [Populus tomentosa]
MTKFRKLNRPTGHRMSMLRTMVSQLIKHERIETTVAKAKEIRRLADNMVQLGKEGSLCAARHATAFVRGDDVIHKLFSEMAYRYKDRAGGYTRMLRTRIRVGDAAPMAYIETVVFAVQIEGLIVEGPNMNQNNVIVQEFRVGFVDSVELCSDLVLFAFRCHM